MDIGFMMKIVSMGGIGLLIFFGLWNATNPLLHGRNAAFILNFIPVAIVAGILIKILKEGKEDGNR